eukprot:scaffold28477_cov112-Isochrysis_galbana.AAC.5
MIGSLPPVSLVVLCALHLAPARLAHGRWLAPDSRLWESRMHVDRRYVPATVSHMHLDGRH